MAIRRIGSQIRESIKDTTLVRIKTLSDDSIIVRDSANHDKFELWFPNDHHAGYTLDIEGQGYEFARSLTEAEVLATD